MRALVYDRYGSSDGLVLRDVPDPVPRAGEVLVRVRAAALNPKDVFTLTGRFRFLSGRRFPKVVGLDLAGEVISPSGAPGFEAGQAVYGFLSGFAATRGSVAERVAVPAGWLAPLPRQAAFQEAAAIALAGSTALQALRDVAQLRRGDRILIHGASGGVGALAVQLAKQEGAHVTATAGGARVALCRALGADEAFDHASGEALSGGRRYRIVFDVFGNLSLASTRAALEPGGVFVTTVPSRRIALDTVRTLVGPVRARMVSVRPRTADLVELGRRVDDGRLRAQVDRVFPFAEAREAVRYVQERRAHGKVVIAVA